MCVFTSESWPPLKRANTCDGLCSDMARSRISSGVILSFVKMLIFPPCPARRSPTAPPVSSRPTRCAGFRFCIVRCSLVVSYLDQFDPIRHRPQPDLPTHRHGFHRAHVVEQPADGAEPPEVIYDAVIFSLAHLLQRFCPPPESLPDAPINPAHNPRGADDMA